MINADVVVENKLWNKKIKSMSFNALLRGLLLLNKPFDSLYFFTSLFTYKYFKDLNK